MKNKFYLFLLLINLLLLTACGDSTDKISETTSETTKTTQKVSQPIIPKVYKFNFIDLENQVIRVRVKNNRYDFLDIKQPIVLINFFATWCPPCLGQIPHLNKLQKEYQKHLYIMGILIHDKVKNGELNIFTASQKTDFFISKNIENSIEFANFIAPKLQLSPKFSLPLMILFVNGKYYTHYEGSIPEEMIESDIKQALKKIEG